MSEAMSPERRALFRRALDGGYATPVEYELWAEIDRLEAALSEATAEIRRLTTEPCGDRISGVAKPWGSGWDVYQCTKPKGHKKPEHMDGLVRWDNKGRITNRG